MNFIKGLINKRRGYSLIEAVAAISILLIIMSVVVQFFMSVTTEYKTAINNVREKYYINEAFRYIEVELDYEVKKTVEVSNNVLIISRFYHKNSDEKPIRHIKLQGNELVVKYYDKNGHSAATNIILRNIEEFRVSKTNHYIYIALKLEEGPLEERCLALNYIER